MPYGQMVLGPPGTGKTTYCHGMQQWYAAIGRKLVLINLDPANFQPPYAADIDVTNWIDVDTVMMEKKLGPNGALIHCIHVLDENFQRLQDQLAPYLKDPTYYYIFDCPGQAELFTHDPSLKNIIVRLEKMDFRLAAVNLIDASYCTDLPKFVLALILCLNTMAQIELPHINVLSKMDLIESCGRLAFPLEFYTRVMDLDYLLQALNEQPLAEKYKRFNAALCELIESSHLVGFQTLYIEDKVSLSNLVKAIDKANGYIFGSLEEVNQSIMSTAVRADYAYDQDIEENYLCREDAGSS